MVDLIELLCTAGLPALFTQILSAHELSWWEHQPYLALYIVAYMFDDALMVTLSRIPIPRSSCARTPRTNAGCAMCVQLGLR